MKIEEDLMLRIQYYCDSAETKVEADGIKIMNYDQLTEEERLDILALLQENRDICNGMRGDGLIQFKK